MWTKKMAPQDQTFLVLLSWWGNFGTMTLCPHNMEYLNHTHTQRERDTLTWGGCPICTTPPNLQTHITTPRFLPALQLSFSQAPAGRPVLFCSHNAFELLMACSSTKTVNILRNRPVTETLAVYQLFSKMVVHAVPKQNVHTNFKKCAFVH